MYGWQIAALRKGLVLRFIETSSSIAVNRVLFERVMKFLWRRSAVVHPNNSAVGVIHILLSHLAEGNRFPNRSVRRRCGAKRIHRGISQYDQCDT